MKKRNLLFVLPLLTVFFTTGCVHKDVYGKDSIKDFTYEADDFSEIEIKNIHLKSGMTTYGPKVNLLPGLEKKITISMDENFESEIKVKKVGNKKVIQGNSLHNLVTDRFDINLYGYVLSEIDLSGACEANVSSLCLDKNKLDIDLSGACKITLDSYDGVDLFVDLSGASSLNVGDCKVENANIELSGASYTSFANLKTTKLDLDLSGASTINLRLGSANNFSGDVSGASEVKASFFELETGKVDVSGASSMYIKVNQSLTGEVSGASTLKYSGEGEVKVYVSGGSSAKKVM